MNKCKGCQWYGKPYWSITNPCDNCPRETTNVEILTRWQDPTIEEQQKEIERLNKIIDIKTNRIQQLLKRLHKRQQRIYKAIEYIRSQYTIIDDDLYLALYSSDGSLDKLEKILRGEDDE